MLQCETGNISRDFFQLLGIPLGPIGIRKSLTMHKEECRKYSVSSSGTILSIRNNTSMSLKGDSGILV